MRSLCASNHPDGDVVSMYQQTPEWWWGQYVPATTRIVMRPVCTSNHPDCGVVSMYQ